MTVTDRTERRRRLAWFAGLYVGSIVAVAGTVYGLKFLLSWISGV